MSADLAAGTNNPIPAKVVRLMYIVGHNSLLSGQAAVSQRNYHMLTWLSSTGRRSASYLTNDARLSLLRNCPCEDRPFHSARDLTAHRATSFSKICLSLYFFNMLPSPFTLWLSSASHPLFTSCPSPHPHLLLRYQSTIQDSSLFWWPTCFLSLSLPVELQLQDCISLVDKMWSVRPKLVYAKGV